MTLRRFILMVAVVGLVSLFSRHLPAITAPPPSFSFGIQFNDNHLLSPSAANTGLLRYNSVLQQFEQSTNGGGYVGLGGTTENLVADATVATNLLIKPSSTTSDRYVVVGTADTNQVIVGVSASLALVAGNSFSAWTTWGVRRVVTSDGSTTISRGDILEISPITAGNVRKCSLTTGVCTGNPVCVALQPGAAVAGTLVACR